MGLHPIVSIIIPCRNEEKYIAENLDSCVSQDYEGEIEVLIVDGMSEDGTREIVSQYAAEGVRLLDNPARYTPNALNIGIEASKGSVFIILGGHAFLSMDFVRLNVTALNSDVSIGCSGGLIENIHENQLSENVSAAMSSKFGVGNATFRVGGSKGFVDTVAFGAYKKSVFQKIGGFDEDLVRNQDDEYNYRLLKEGFKIWFDPNIRSFYYVRGSLRKLFKQYFQYGYWKVYVNKKHRSITTLRQVIPLFFVLGILLGGLASLIVPWFWLFYLSGALLYAGLAFVFAKKSIEAPNRYFSVAVIFPILHFSYGWGYLQGIVNFLIFGKKPSRKSVNMSR